MAMISVDDRCTHIPLIELAWCEGQQPLGAVLRVFYQMNGWSLARTAP